MHSFGRKVSNGTRTRDLLRGSIYAPTNHDLELTALVIELGREFGPDLVVTEREMRAADTPLGSAPATPLRFAVPMSGARGQMQLTPVGHPRLQFPDCAVSASPDRLLAIELERTAKSRARLRRILSGYVSPRHIASVRYYARGERVRELLESEVRALTATSLFDVRRWAGAQQQGQAVRAA